MNYYISRFIAVSSLMIIAMFFTTCAKEYSFEGGFILGADSGTAVYHFDSSGGACINTVLNGSYYTNQVLNATNTIQLEVYVDSIGTYNVTTNTQDDIQFHAAGSFISTGIQSIIFTGSGTPQSNGSFTFVPPVGLGCTFSINVISAPPQVAAFTLSGAPNNCTEPQLTGTYQAGLGLNSNNNLLVIQVDVTVPGTYSITTDTLDGISFSASGKFTNTGSQTITLHGFGTPSFARNLIFNIVSPVTQGCSFDVSVVDAPPLATYVIQSGTGAAGSVCIYKLGGIYNKGVAMNASNTLSTDVYVTVVGNYTIATSEVNGIVFSNSGTFTSVGDQYVTLVASGTPTDSGDFTFVPMIVGPAPLGGEACDAAVTVN